MQAEPIKVSPYGIMNKSYYIAVRFANEVIDFSSNQSVKEAQ